MARPAKPASPAKPKRPAPHINVSRVIKAKAPARPKAPRTEQPETQTSAPGPLGSARFSKY
jgi:hypothetical protein